MAVIEFLIALTLLTFILSTAFGIIATAAMAAYIMGKALFDEVRWRLR